MSLSNILITGAHGQVGRAILGALKDHRRLAPHALNHNELDITDPGDLDIYLKKHKIAALINCAAYTAVDKAESESQACWTVNAYGCRHLARACNQQRIPLLHFSTDYVYHNDLRRPLKETDPCTPKNVYGASKLSGEQKALFHNPRSIILRTSWVYSRIGHNFLNTIKELAKTKGDLNIVNDQVGAPTLAEDLASAVMHILSQVLAHPGEAKWYGIFNCSNYGAISWFDFAGYFIGRLGIPCRIHPVPTSEFPRPALRPEYSVLDLAKIESTFGLKLRDWKTAVDEVLDPDPRTY